MTWLTEHGEEFDCPDLPPGWKDESWANEPCPSYTVGGLTVWMDHPQDGLRENPGGKRFSVELMERDERGFWVHSSLPWTEHVPVILETDDWQAVLSFVASHPYGC